MKLKIDFFFYQKSLIFVLNQETIMVERKLSQELGFLLGNNFLKSRFQHENHIVSLLSTKISIFTNIIKTSFRLFLHTSTPI